MLSKEQIDRLDELAAKATPGKWKTGAHTPLTVYSGHPICNTSNGHQYEEDSANAEFIAAANPQSVSELIAMLRESESKANAAVKALAKMVIECYPVTEEQAIASVEKSLRLDCDGAHHAEGGECL